MIEVKSPRHPIIASGDESEEKRIGNENEELINSYSGDNDVEVHL